jgi:hypothetical protein
MVNGPPGGRATVPLKCRRRRASLNCAHFGSVSLNAPSNPRAAKLKSFQIKRHGGLDVPLFVVDLALAPCVRFLSRLIAGERTASIMVG